jgi:hypothetical protein
MSVINQGQGRGVASPLGAILFYHDIKEYAEKVARLLASHCLWQWLVPFTPATQAALAKLGLTPSNIPRLTGLTCFRSGGVTREGGSIKPIHLNKEKQPSNVVMPQLMAPPM